MSVIQPNPIQTTPIQQTKSLCPECLQVLPATIIAQEQNVYLQRTCPLHGQFSELIWRGEPNFVTWRRPKPINSKLTTQTQTGLGCPYDCGLCPQHTKQSCTVLWEITDQCNLQCPVCFASAGQGQDFTSKDILLEQLHWIHKVAGTAVLQVSGGEPTLHPDLVELVQAAKKLFPAVQLNTNGLRLADQPQLAHDLAQAGLAWVFLQFDGTTDAIYESLRGQKLLDKKLQAIANCQAANLSVVLVPTIAVGVNDHDLGNLLDLALSLHPTVRGLHLQPMTKSGRNNISNSGLTLPEVLTKLVQQSSGRVQINHANAPGCEHERCSFNCRYLVKPSGELTWLGQGSCCAESNRSVLPEQQAVEVIVRSWGKATSKSELAIGDAFDQFIARANQQTFSLTCMAFQDVRTVDLERLQGCCVHVFVPPDRLIPFCAYNLTSLDGRALYRNKK